MKSYGQFCPLALSSEIVGERWTPLILRELMCGSSRFNDIHRGIPRMSPTLLADRLKTLETAGIVERRRSEKVITGYYLTEAGAELAQVIEGLSVWGKTWLPATLSREQADPDLIMWDLHRRIDLNCMPSTRTVIRFDFTDQPKPKRHRWIVGDVSSIDLCITDPGFEVDLFVETDSRTMMWVWYGDIPLKRAIDDGAIMLDGPRRLCEMFPTWLLLNPLAPVPRRSPL
jgi:DNA-binding HxlR family transcriptional regulator